MRGLKAPDVVELGQDPHRRQGGDPMEAAQRPGVVA